MFRKSENIDSNKTMIWSRSKQFPVFKLASPATIPRPFQKQSKKKKRKSHNTFIYFLFPYSGKTHYVPSMSCFISTLQQTHGEKKWPCDPGWCIYKHQEGITHEKNDPRHKRFNHLSDMLPSSLLCMNMYTVWAFFLPLFFQGEKKVSLLIMGPDFIGFMIKCTAAEDEREREREYTFVSIMHND